VVARRGPPLAACASILAAVVLAQSGSPEADRQKDLENIRDRIATLQKMLAESRKNQASLAEEVRRLDLQVEIAQQESRLLSTRREQAAASLAGSEAQRQAAAESAEQSRRALVGRARILQRFGRFGYFRVLLEARDAQGLFLAVERLDALARRDGQLLARHRDAQERFTADSARVASLKAEIDGLFAANRQSEHRAETLKAERQALLSREKSLSASRSEEVGTLIDKAARLERLLETLSRQSDGEPVDPSGGIRPWKGVLDWPAKGTVVETFGRHRHPRFDAWTVSNGVALSIAAGTPVRAVYSGKALYAQWLAEYGNLVILDHGDGVFTLYAWLQSVTVGPGAYVPVGSEVGLAGTGPGRDEPGLYFEVRDHQKANDPVAWLR
jgi:septal ring factor EnvC (AmiA/AmiB activator)